MTYFITFACHGCHLHGTADGSVDRKHNLYGSQLVEPNPERLTRELELMDQSPYQMDEQSRAAVLEAITGRCKQADWHPLAVHVRSNHVHVVVEAQDQPEFVMTQLKSAASRRLNVLGFDHSPRKHWSRPAAHEDCLTTKAFNGQFHT